jgi:hypothetical protein
MSTNVKKWDALRDAAMACEGWSWPDRMRDENGTHHFGQRREGEFYQIGTIDAWTYTSDYADDIRVLKFIRAAQPEAVLSLFSEIDRLRAALQAQQGTIGQAVAYCYEVRQPFTDPFEWAEFLDRDKPSESRDVRNVRALGYIDSPSAADAGNQLEDAALVAIRETAPPRDRLGPPTSNDKMRAQIGERIAEKIRALKPGATNAGAQPVEQSPYEAITLANLRAGKLSAARVYVGYCEVSEELKAANGAIKRYQAQAAPAPTGDLEWRRLALQFDGHRMQAIGHLKCMLKDPQAHKDVAEKFLSAGPISGEEVLAERIKALAPAPATLSDEQIMRIIGDVRQRNAGTWPGDVVVARSLLAAAGNGQGQDGRILGLLREARAALEMWKDVAPAVSLCADIDAALEANEQANMRPARVCGKIRTI